MFDFCSISSSSAGNCLLVHSENTKILVDTGVSIRKINTELLKINLSINDIDAILITHEHCDHCKSIENISKKYMIPIYTNSETWSAIDALYPNIDKSLKNIFKINSSINIGDFLITSFETSHDCIKSCGYSFLKNGKKVSIATDMGYVSDIVMDSLSNSDFTFIESNYDIDMLNCSKYPYQLKRRISSNIGHLSNLQCSNAIVELYQKNTHNFMIGHLSKENNFPELAISTIENTLLNNNIDLSTITLDIAKRECMSNIVKLEK